MTDQAIVDLFWERSQAAIEETEKAYGRYFHYIAHSILQNDEDSEEIVNDTYLKAWNTIPPERPHHLKAFLGNITRQLAINRLEHNLAQKRGGGQYPTALDELTECIPDGDGGDDIAELSALTDSLNVFLRSLPTEERRVFIRRYWHMHPIRPIANDFSMSESKVKSLLLRIRKKLKTHLQKEGFGI